MQHTMMTAMTTTERPLHLPVYAFQNEHKRSMNDIMMDWRTYRDDNVNLIIELIATALTDIDGADIRHAFRGTRRLGSYPRRRLEV